VDHWQNIIIIIFSPNIFHCYEERREEEGEKVKHEEKSQIVPFEHILQKFGDLTMKM
jgi:hypothetical protein